MPEPGKVLARGPIRLQELIDFGLNAFAIELVSESFHTSGLLKAVPDNPISFEWDGIKITLERVGEPRHPRIRRELGLPVPAPTTTSDERKADAPQSPRLV